MITTRGTQSNGAFSRGNNFPATAVPHGFNFWTPLTNAGSSWLYQYHSSNTAENFPRLQAFGLSHEPSPWMGEEQLVPLPGATETSLPTHWNIHGKVDGYGFEDLGHVPDAADGWSGCLVLFLLPAGAVTEKNFEIDTFRATYLYFLILATTGPLPPDIQGVILYGRLADRSTVG